MVKWGALAGSWVGKRTCFMRSRSLVLSTIGLRVGLDMVANGVGRPGEGYDAASKNVTWRCDLRNASRRVNHTKWSTSMSTPACARASHQARWLHRSASFTPFTSTSSAAAGGSPGCSWGRQSTRSGMPPRQPA